MRFWKINEYRPILNAPDKECENVCVKDRKRRKERRKQGTESGAETHTQT